MAIKADKTRVMDNINRLDNHEGPGIAAIVLGQYSLFEKAVAIPATAREENLVELGDQVPDDLKAMISNGLGLPARNILVPTGVHAGRRLVRDHGLPAVSNNGALTRRSVKHAQLGGPLSVQISLVASLSMRTRECNLAPV